MGEEENKSRHVLYGSAGMAAAGMIPSSRRTAKKPEPDPEPEVEQEEEIEDTPIEEEVEATESAEEAAEESTAAEEESEPEEEPTPEEPEVQFTRAGVIGHTGSGDFGIGLDKVYQRLDGVRLDAITDLNADALEDTRSRIGAPAGYSDYAEMLEKEDLDLVCVACGWPDEHFQMIKAALEAEVNVFTEVPFVSSLKEADELIALADEKALKLAVAQQLRGDPNLQKFREEYPELIGELLELHVFGNMATNAGGEDLLLHGTHLFDVVRWFAGEVSYCTSQITKDGAPAIADDAHESSNGNFGLLLGDTIRAEFVMESEITVTFLSDARMAEMVGPWGIEFVGTKSRARLYAGLPPVISILKKPDPASPNRKDKWYQWPEGLDEYHEPIDKFTGMDAANRRVVKDWLESIENDREPACSAFQAMKALEMVHGVWQAGASMKRAYFPLINRFHPLSEESQ